MLIGGFQKFSLIDYPGKISAVVFLLGCNFRCGFCHNPELVDPDFADWKTQILEDDILKFLEERKGKLEGVCITGGEPTIWQDLPEFIKKIKKLGFSVKLDTNGTNYEMVKVIVESRLVDYFAIDIKNSPEKYSQTTDTKMNIENLEKILKIIIDNNIALELRTTIVPGLHSKEDMIKVKEWLDGLGVLNKTSLYALQQFRPFKTLNEKYKNVIPYSEAELKEMAEVFEGKVETEVRGV